MKYYVDNYSVICFFNFWYYGHIFGPFVFIYSVVRFRSNDSLSLNLHVICKRVRQCYIIVLLSNDYLTYCNLCSGRCLEIISTNNFDCFEIIFEMAAMPFPCNCVFAMFQVIYLKFLFFLVSSPIPYPLFRIVILFF